MRLAVTFLMVAVSVLLYLPIATAEVSAINKEPAKQIDLQKQRDTERQAVLTGISMSDAGMVLSCRERRYSFDGDIEWLYRIGEVAQFFPHRLGWFDSLYFASATLDDQPWIRDEICASIDTVSDWLFGYAGEYDVMLWDFPRATLLKNLELLNRLPKCDNVNVRVYAERLDDQLLRAVRKLWFRYEVLPCDLSRLATTDGHVAGAVVDRRGNPVAGATVFVHAQDGKPISHLTTTDKLGRFLVSQIPSVPYRIGACKPSAWLAHPETPVTFSDSVNAEPGNKNVRLVLEVAAAPRKPGRDR